MASMTMNGVKKTEVKLNLITEVNEFVAMCSTTAPKDLFLQSAEDDCHIVRASSMLGIYSLNLSEKILFVYNEEDADNETIKAIIEKFGVKD